jgi:hypothetical protein
MANELRSAFDEFMRAFHRRITTTVLSVSVGQAISLIQCKRPMYLILYNIVCLFRMSILSVRAWKYSWEHVATRILRADRFALFVTLDYLYYELTYRKSKVAKIASKKKKSNKAHYL